MEALQAELQAEGVEQMNEMHSLMALLRSLLPWVADGEQPDYYLGIDDGGGGGGGGGAAAAPPAPPQDQA